MSDPLALCKHRFVYDPSADEVVCENGCGLAAPTYHIRVPGGANDQSAIVSPGMIGGGLGTDLNENIKEQRLLRGLNRFVEGSDDSDFWVTLTEALASRGVPPEQIALNCAFLRKVRGQLTREVASELRNIVKYGLGIIL